MLFLVRAKRRENASRPEYSTSHTTPKAYPTLEFTLIVGHQPRIQRQVCPPPETAGRDTGGPRTSDSEGRGGREGRGGQPSVKRQKNLARDQAIL